MGGNAIPVPRDRRADYFKRPMTQCREYQMPQSTAAMTATTRSLPILRGQTYRATRR